MQTITLFKNYDMIKGLEKLNEFFSVLRQMELKDNGISDSVNLVEFKHIEFEKIHTNENYPLIDSKKTITTNWFINKYSEYTVKELVHEYVTKDLNPSVINQKEHPICAAFKTELFHRLDPEIKCNDYKYLTFFMLHEGLWNELDYPIFILKYINNDNHKETHSYWYVK